MSKIINKTFKQNNVKLIYIKRVYYKNRKFIYREREEFLKIMRKKSIMKKRKMEIIYITQSKN